MPYTPQSWANSPATSSPLTAARLAHIETQHAQALADVAADVSDSGSDIGAALSATFVSVDGTPADGDAIVWDDIAGEWVPAPVEGGGAALTVLSEAEGNTGTATTARAISAERLKQQIEEHGITVIPGAVVRGVIVATGSEARPAGSDVVVWIDPSNLGATNKLSTDPLINPGALDAEFIRDTIGATLVAGTNVTVTVNDGADTITIAATGGGSSLQEAPRLTGRFHYPTGLNPASMDGSGLFTADAAQWWMFDGAGYTYDAICAWVRTAGAGGALLRFAVYAVAADGYPGSLIVDAGTIDASVAAENIKTFTPTVLNGWVWGVLTCNDTAVRITKAWNPTTFPYGVTKDDPSELRSFLRQSGYPPGTAFPSTALTSGRSWQTEGPLCSIRRSA